MNVHKTGSYPCDECDKVCKSESSLYAHKYTVHRKHEKEKTFACLECGKMFVLQSDLNVHHRTWLRLPSIFSLTLLMAKWLDMKELENKNHASLSCLFDSLGPVHTLSA